MTLRNLSHVLIALLAVSATAQATPTIYFRTVSCDLKTPSTAEDVVQRFDILLNIEQFGQSPQDGLLSGELLAPAGSAAKTLGLALTASFKNDKNLKLSSSIDIGTGTPYVLDVNLKAPATAADLANGTATISDGTNITDYNCVGYSP